MFTANQFVAHLVGDYLLQSGWMAAEKSRNSWAALAHVLAYMVPFLLLTQEPIQLFWIVATHFVIDRWHLARYVCWARNQIAPSGRRATWEESRETGHPPAIPSHISTFLAIVIDNAIHLVINGLVLTYL